MDASAGASGDMLLGALLGAGVPVEVLQSAVDSVVPVQLSVSPAVRAGFAALRCCPVLPEAVPGSAPDSVVEAHPHRTWADVSALLAASSLAPPVRSRAEAAFAALAAAEGAVHGIAPEQVTFHEVGALDAIADVVGVCAGFVHLGLERLVVSPVAVGSGRVDSEHGSLPVPAPAVVELLRGAPTLAGPGDRESCTPTGAALLRTWAYDFGPQPAMTVSDIGIGAGSRDPAGHANVVRLLVGHPPDDSAGTVVLLEANVDDQDPRVWPTVLADLLSVGAVDAWLVPITMKKGRPAHTVCALVPPAAAAAVRSVLFTATSTIGVRESTRSRTVLDREVRTITVHGHAIRVKIARHAGTVVDAQPEFDDVEAAARALGLPVRAVLRDAVRAVPESWHMETSHGDPPTP